MKKKTLYWLDGKLMGERTEDEVEEIIKMAKATGYAIHRRPGHVLVYTAGWGKAVKTNRKKYWGRSR